MQPARGFTLPELLVALSTLALLAGAGWQGLAGISQAQARIEARTTQVLTLQAALTQWSTDLDALAQLPQAGALEWDGRALRITRRGMAGETGQAGQSGYLHVVAWTQRQGQWLRWQSPPLVTRGDVQAAWRQADRWAQAPLPEDRPHELAVTPLAAWQLYYFRDGAWSHPLSSEGTGSGAVRTSLVPDGLRLVLTLPPGQALAGRIERDWASPRLGGERS